MTAANLAVFERAYGAATYRPKAGYFGALHATRLAMLRTLPRPARLLDVGCGSGAFLLPLVREGRQVTGLDYSPRILAELRGEALRHEVDPDRLDVVPGDACAMPLEDASYDAAFSFATLYAIPDVERALAEIARVLRPGGLAFLELGNSRSLNALEAQRIGNGLATRHLSCGRMRHMLRGAGFGIERVRRFQLFPLWGGGTPRACELNRRLETVLGETHDGRLLDERIASSPWLAPFAFRQLWIVRKGGADVPEAPVGEPGPEPDDLRERRRLAAEAVARGEVDAAVEELLAGLREHPDDPRAALDLAAVYDGEAEQRLVRSWRKALTRTRRWPALGAPRTAAPSTPPRAPKLSVVLPTFDAAHQLPEAVQSVFDQTFGDFELIVVDDGSRDDTWRYLARIDDPRVRVLRQSNQRLPAALDAGFDLARGELRTWISADNVCLPTMFAQLVAALDAEPAAVLAVAGFARVDARLGRRGEVTGQDVSPAGFVPRNPGVAAFAYRASTARQVGGHAAELEGAEDWDYWLRLVAHGPAVLIPDVLYLYREHARSMTSTIPAKVHAASVAVVQRWLARHGGGLPPLRELAPQLAADRTDPAVGAFWGRFGTRLLASPFAPPTMAVEALQRGLQATPQDGRLVVQLAVALARAGALPAAAQLAVRFATAPDPGLRRLAAELQALAAGRGVRSPAELPLLPWP